MEEYNSRSQSEKPTEEYPLCDKKWDLPTVPKDTEGYVIAFDCNQVQDFLKFFDEFGFVVIKNVLNENQIKNTIDEIWTEIEGSPYTSQPTRAQELYIEVLQNHISNSHHRLGCGTRKGRKLHG